jgi:hypothetical protein
MAFKNYGLNWDRKLAEEVDLYGKRWGSKPVYFGGQIGIYTLEKNEKIIYVGKSGTGENASIAVRLKDHTTNNKRNKWDTFSWFGLRAVRSTGTLVATPTVIMDTGALIQDFETILIYLLQPRYNMRAGKYRHMEEYKQCRPLSGM